MTEGGGEALERYPIRGQKLAVMGSTVPWYEAIALEHGATVTTIEYNTIVCDCPDVKTLTVEEYSRSPRTFDAAFSISSFEHDGLGRYGDPLNPEGDLQAMRKMKSTVKPGGLLTWQCPWARTRSSGTPIASTGAGACHLCWRDGKWWRESDMVSFACCAIQGRIEVISRSGCSGMFEDQDPGDYVSQV